RLYPNLEYIDLSGCKNITDVSICDIAHYCQKLEHFDISSCDISDLAIEKIATSSNNLKFLNIQLCGGISENAVKKLNSNIKVKGIDRFAWVVPHISARRAMTF
ncbi:10856_t:CDS:2, partial [Racocetra fulgida]